jgi:hypothetical protein
VDGSVGMNVLRRNRCRMRRVEGRVNEITNERTNEITNEIEIEIMRVDRK